MNRFTYRACWCISLLDWLPRYGRHYTYARADYDRMHRGHSPRHRTMQWRWCWRGLWGFNMLIRWRLFGRFLDEVERRRDVGRTET